MNPTPGQPQDGGACVTATWATAGPLLATAGRSRLGDLNPPGPAAGREQTPLVGFGVWWPCLGCRSSRSCSAVAQAGPSSHRERISLYLLSNELLRALASG